MKKYGYGVLAAFAAVLVSLALSSSAQAYPDARIDLTVDHQVVYAGDSFTATGTTTVACAMDLEWNDVVRNGGAVKRFAATYVAPEVTRVTQIPVHAVCRPAATGALRNKVTVTVLPRGNGAGATPADTSADLPGTGGPDLVWLLGGVVLLLAGATAVTVARRRAEEIELPGQTA